MKNKVVNYDGFDYDYTQYWKRNRDYENIAEHIVLEKLLKDCKGRWFLDIGGSYGRLTDTYADKFDNCVILDYSLKTLKRREPFITKKFPNTTLIAANAYKMPFEYSTFDGALMVRVLHHIERQDEYFEELSRVLNGNSIYIQEFANKIHIKARIKAIFKKDPSLFDKTPYQQPTINMEGSRDGDVSFLNYHPEYIKELLEKYSFDIKTKQGCSFFRIPLLKKILSTQLLIFFERISQSILRTSDVPPSIFFKSILKKDNEKDTSEYLLEDILVCPECKHTLSFGENEAICDNCHKKYIKDGNVWDFRIE